MAGGWSATGEPIRGIASGPGARFRRTIIPPEKNDLLSVLDLLKKRIDDLKDENKSLAAFITADGPGGM